MTKQTVKLLSTDLSKVSDEEFEAERKRRELARKVRAEAERGSAKADVEKYIKERWSEQTLIGLATYSTKAPVVYVNPDTREEFTPTTGLRYPSWLKDSMGRNLKGKALKAFLKKPDAANDDDEGFNEETDAEGNVIRTYFDNGGKQIRRVLLDNKGTKIQEEDLTKAA